MKYCTTVEISQNIRVDLFTEESFRVRVWRSGQSDFSEKYDIPFAVGRLTPWKEVRADIDGRTDWSMVVIKTQKLIVYVRKDTGTFMVERQDGKRLYPETAPRYGMFKNHCIVFDSAGFWNEESNCSRYSHWFYNRETGLYDILLKEDKLFDTYFIYAETYKKGYALFNELVGAEPMLPKKGYGFYQTQHLAKDGSQALLMQTASLLRSRDIPCDTLILDFEWGDGANGGKECPWGSRLDWSDEYSTPYPPEIMLKKLKEMHFDVMTIHHSIPAYSGRMDEGWVCAEYEHDIWWQKMQEQLDSGVVGTWQDTRQTDVTNARIYSEFEKRTGRRVTMLSNYDVYRDSSWTKDCVMTPKRQKVGGRRTPFYWTGDTAVNTWDDLAFQINAIVNEHGALSGISYLTNDGMRPGGRALATRCDQFLCFNSVARSHNAKPWQSPESSKGLAENMAIVKDKAQKTEQKSAEALLGLDNTDTVQEKNIRKFLKIRYRLLPYIYSAARECYDTGLPITRPLMVEFEGDVNCNQNQYPTEYMFGKDILVCPVCNHSERMEIYLPASCNWIDFFTGERLDGGKKYVVDVTDLSVMPVFVRSGAVIPMREEKNWIDGDESDLMLKIYGEGSGECILYEDDGVSLGYRTGEYSVTKIISRSEDKKAVVTIDPICGSYSGITEYRTVIAEYNGASSCTKQNKKRKTVLTVN